MIKAVLGYIIAPYYFFSLLSETAFRLLVEDTFSDLGPKDLTTRFNHRELTRIPGWLDSGIDTNVFKIDKYALKVYPDSITLGDLHVYRTFLDEVNQYLIESQAKVIIDGQDADVRCNPVIYQDVHPTLGQAYTISPLIEGDKSIFNNPEIVGQMQKLSVEVASAFDVLGYMKIAPPNYQLVQEGSKKTVVITDVAHCVRRLLGRLSMIAIADQLKMTPDEVQMKYF